jgi:GNAT superfamily N-acetyltransferase
MARPVFTGQMAARSTARLVTRSPEYTMEFPEALTAAYLEDPGKVLPNALWKTLGWLKDSQTHFSLDAQGRPQHLEIYQPGRLILYWDRDRSVFAPNLIRQEKLTFALIHQDYLPALAHLPLMERKPFFRLVYRPGSAVGAPVPALPEGYRFQPAHAAQEAEAIASLLGQCYQNLAIDPDTVRGWADSPAYAPHLWIWVWDAATSQPAGLGIADLDVKTGEGSLEWIQILPAYQGLGLGKGIVNELLRRLNGTADFVTVSGEVNNPSNPEQIYRRCGFSGDDVWWLMA